MLAPVSDESPAPAPAPAPQRHYAGSPRTGPVKNPWPFMLLAVGLAIAGWLLVSWMQQNSSLQDCYTSGRRNCGDLSDPKLGR